VSASASSLYVLEERWRVAEGLRGTEGVLDAAWQKSVR
jgi:hypothetical protein